MESYNLYNVPELYKGYPPDVIQSNQFEQVFVASLR